MKITFILPGIGIAGGVRVVFEYSNRLIKLGDEVYIIYPIIPYKIILRSKLKSIIYKIMVTFVNIKNARKTKLYDTNAKLSTVLTINPRFLNLTKNSIPDSDVVIATSWETAFFVNALPEEKGKKFYFVQHYEIWDIWNSPKCWEEAREIEKRADKLPIAMSYIVPNDPYLIKLKYLVDSTYKMPLEIITISSWLKELLETHFLNQVSDFITNGVNFNKFYCINKNWDKREKIILTPYRGIPWKGDLDCLEAFKIVYRAHSKDAVFWCYGPKKPKDFPQFIKFFENPNDEYLRKLYCKAHILIVASWVEGSQLPPMEGMACKCAVIATNVGGVPDYAIPNETAIIIPPKDPYKIAEGINYLLENWDETRRIAENGYRYIQQFTWDRATLKFKEHLRKKM
jgi:glycosyltransferase involved in cell wall biosynthesis